MEFVVCANILKKEFISYLVEWSVHDKWNVVTQGYPVLHFDFYRQELCLSFRSLEAVDKIYTYPLPSFKFSINQKSFVITLELNNSPVDIALCFRDIEHCVKFKLLLIHSLQLRILKRKTFRGDQNRGHRDVIRL